MRKQWGVTALIGGLALLFSAGAMPAYADPGNGNGNGNGNANGNGNGGAANAGGNGSGNGGTGSQAGTPAGANGTVKIHDWPEHKNSSDMANDPKVCEFEVHGFNFDSGQTGRWWIQEHKWGNGDSTKAAAPVGIRTYTASGSGDWTSGPYRLDDGHYKLFVEMTHSAGNSGNTVTTYKMKVFKVECPVSGGTTGGTTTGGTTTGGTTTGGTTTGGTTTEGGTTTGGTTTTAVAGFESMPAGGLDHTQPGAVAGSQNAVAGSQSAPAALAAIASLPSTSTGADAPLGLIGLVLTSLGAALLRRNERHN